MVCPNLQDFPCVASPCKANDKEERDRIQSYIKTVIEHKPHPRREQPTNTQS